jgi:hypothetical protein
MNYFGGIFVSLVLGVVGACFVLELLGPGYDHRVSKVVWGTLTTLGIVIIGAGLWVSAQMLTR